jgi:hypothetical protein
MTHDGPPKEVNIATTMKQLPVIPTSPLPPLYAAWIDQFLAGPIPIESDATCDDCAMLPDDEQMLTRSDLFFNPETKCCSYIPELPNYLVGRILSDDDPAFSSGRATVQARLSAGVGVTPLGLAQPPNFEVLYGFSSATLFGQSRTLRCPHYLADEGGRCGVWKHRASVCATWHCKYVRGQVGHEFWITLHQLLSTVEKTLSRWCVLELDIGTDAFRHLFPRPAPSGRTGRLDPRALDGAADPLESRRLWGSRAGREAEFYIDCARLVNALDWPKVVAIGGPDVQVYARLLRAAYGKLRSKEIPARLKVGAIQVVGMDRDYCRVTSYSSYDPVSIPRQLIDLLGYFDGRPTEEVLRTIDLEQGIKLDRKLVRRLTDFSVLVPA